MKYLLLSIILLTPTIGLSESELTDCELGFTNRISFSAPQSDILWYFNSSNQSKIKHLNSSLVNNNIQILTHDLAEIKADQLSVVVHKASQFNDPNMRVIVEDTSLVVGMTDIGEDIKWRIHELPQHRGRRAIWISMMAYRVGETVYVFQRYIRGFICHQKPGLDGIEAHFKPENLNEEYTPPSVMTFQDVMRGRVYRTVPAIDNWNGEWQ